MRSAAALLASAIVAVFLSAALDAQTAPTCQQRPQLAQLTVAQRSYARIEASVFGGRTYVYVPDIKSNVFGRSFEPFVLWVVEGIYGRPFVESSGSLDEADFEKMRRSQNVRTTGVKVAPGSKPAAEKFVVSRQTFLIEVVTVNVSFRGTDTVTVKICR